MSLLPKVTIHRTSSYDLANQFNLSDADPKVLARGTPGFSGADLQNMVK